MSLQNSIFNRSGSGHLILVLVMGSLISLHAHATQFTFEGSGSQLMETSISRNGNIAYEAAVGFSRDSNFNLQQSVQPGWMLNATAIGNLINVQMSGAGNNVVVNAMQLNRGSQTAIVTVGTDRMESRNTSNETSTNATPAPNADVVRFQAAAQAGMKN